MSIVSSAYTRNAENEWLRLAKSPYHALEFIVTMHYLRKYLPPGATVLDAGGGPGRYAIELCREGHQVTLFDLTPALLDTARAKIADEPQEVRVRLADIIQGDLRDMSRFRDGEFDAAICLGGPISHFPVAEDRRQAVSELARVTKSGGLVFVAACGYLAVLRTILRECSYELTNGVTDRLEQSGNGFTWGEMDWHFFRADELGRLAESCGLVTLAPDHQASHRRSAQRSGQRMADMPLTEVTQSRLLPH